MSTDRAAIAAAAPRANTAVFERVVTPRAFEQVCNQIRAQLASGALKPGDKLPAERVLAANLNVSRGVLREALRSLEIAGLVVLKKGGAGGAFIAEGQARMFTQALGDMMYLGTISFSDLTEARSLIMADAIGLACERATEEDLLVMEENIALTESLTRDGRFDRRAIVATDFYRLIALAAKNQVLVVSVDALTETLRRFLQLPGPDSVLTPIGSLVTSRRRFMKHMRARDAARAVREMKTYLAGLHQHMLAGNARRSAALGGRV